jgi:serine/threonine-protein kinase
MKFVDDFLAQKRAQKLRFARSMNETDLHRLMDELAAMGPSAILPLSECLSHGEARAPAIEVLDRLLNDQTLDLFLGLLASPNPTVVSGAVRVLSDGRSFTPRRLLGALKESSPPKSVLEPVLREHVGSLPVSEMTSLLPSLARDGQSILLRTLERSPDPNLVPALLQLLKHEDPWLRASLAKFLAEHPGPGVVPGLVELLHDPGKGVRYEAVLALHALGAREAVPALIGVLEDPDLKVQTAGIDALRVLADVTAVPGLVAVLTNESEYVRRGAVEVLNEVATAEAIQDLVRALRDQDWWVRVRAADALGTLGGEKVVEAVVGLMQDEDDFIRRHAVEILNAVPNPAALPTLVAALEDKDWWVRERAIDALGKTRDERAVDPLLKLLEQENSTAALCVRALGAIGHPRTLRSLVVLLDSPMPEIRREAQVALQEFPRGELSSDDRNFLHEVLARANVASTHSTEIPMRVRGTTPGTSLLRDHPFASPLGGDPTPRSPQVDGPGLAGASHSPRRQLGFVPAAREAGGPLPPAIRREPAGALGLNFSDLAEGQEFLDRYRILRKIGRGGFGTVYLAQDAVIQEEIILKVLNPQLSMDDTAARRFIQELKLTRRVSHKSVIRIHDFLDLGGARAISMEYFPGKDLGRMLTEGGPIDLVRVLRIAAQVCDGLAAAHAEGVIHRDIKPPNILVGENDETRLVDFGLASVRESPSDGSRLTKSGLLIGTPEYMAPEQITGDSVDHRVDLYSLGIVLYEAVSGVKPYTADTPVKVLFQHLEGGATPLRGVLSSCPETVSDLVARAMAREPNDRPASALELRAAIDRALESLEAAR